MLLLSLNGFCCRKINTERPSDSRDLCSTLSCITAPRRVNVCHRAFCQISVQGISAAVVWISHTIWVRGPTSLPFCFSTPFICMQTLSSQHVFSSGGFFLLLFAKSHLCSLAFSALGWTSRSWRCSSRRIYHKTLKLLIQRGQPRWRAFCILRATHSVMHSLKQQLHQYRWEHRSGIRKLFSETDRIACYVLHLCLFRVLL